MGEWKTRQLSELIEIKHGFAFKGECFCDYPTSDVLITPGNFAIGGGFQLNKPKFYDGPVPDEYVLASGDVIVTMTDLSKQADTLGYSAIVPSGALRFLHNQRVGKVSVKSDEADLRFIGWLLRTNDYRNTVVGSATGSTVKHTSPSRILEYTCMLPPRGEQQAIAAVLSTLDDKIELHRRMNETLEASARAFFRDWFVDFGPTRAKMAGAVPYLSPDLWPLFPATLDAEGKPEGWEWSTIGKEVDAVGGSTPSTKDDALWNGDIAWTTPKDLSGLNSPVLMRTGRTISEAGLRTISSGLLPVGTVLMSSRAPVGYLAISQIPLAINQGYIAMRCDGRVSNWHAYLWAKENMDAILQNANGSTFQEISKSNFRPLPILVANKTVRNRFDHAIQPMFEQIISNEREIHTLAETRDALLLKLMSGEIRVAQTGSDMRNLL
jgi:type I restriction enzyme S subunit